LHYVTGCNFKPHPPPPIATTLRFCDVQFHRYTILYYSAIYTTVLRTQHVCVIGLYMISGKMRSKSRFGSIALMRDRWQARCIAQPYYAVLDYCGKFAEVSSIHQLYSYSNSSSKLESQIHRADLLLELLYE